MKFNLFIVMALLCPLFTYAQLTPATPLDDVVERTTLREKKPLPYQPLRAVDVVWSKKIWEEIDTRQKKNLYFRSPHAALYEILAKGIASGEITAYSPEDDRFLIPLSISDFIDATSSSDTITITDPSTFVSREEVVREYVDFESVMKFRIKEVWYFDGLTSTMRVRILGIAPIVSRESDAGDALFEYPLFWVYYPDCRAYLSQFEVFNTGNDMGRMSWEDLLEMRKFEATITKASNTLDQKLSANFVGRTLLLEAEKIKTEIRDIEQDMWEY